MFDFLAQYWWVCGLAVPVGIVIFFCSAIIAQVFSKDNLWAALLAGLCVFMGWLIALAGFWTMVIGIVCALIRYAQSHP